MNQFSAVSLVGKKFGRLTVIAQAPSVNHRSYWACQCACGNKIIVVRSSLIAGLTKSCWCLRRQLVSARSKTHGMRSTRQYNIHYAMLRRCLDKKNRCYAYYGGRGIRVCRRWRTFENFWADMGPSYRAGLSLDRIDNSKGYSKENCRWATAKQQSRNRRNVRKFEYNGQNLTLSEWEEQFNLPRKYLYPRVIKTKTPFKRVIAPFFTK